MTKSYTMGEKKTHIHNTLGEKHANMVASCIIVGYICRFSLLNNNKGIIFSVESKMYF